MLKKFILNTLSSFVGAWIALALTGIVAVLVIFGLVIKSAGSTEAESVKKNSILCLNLDGTIIEKENRMAPDYVELLQGNIEKPQTLTDIVEGLKAGAENKDIKALYIKCGIVSASPATMNAVRNAVIEFKKSGKKIIAYSPNYTLGTYYVASVADKIFLNPYGEVMISGLGTTSLYFKSLLDKLGVSFQVVKVGTFKSAVEPYISNEMSEPARAQLDTLFGSMWGFMKEKIAESRPSLTPEKFDSIVNNMSFSSPEDFRKCRVIDSLAYERSVNDELASIAGVDKKDLNIIGTSTLAAQVLSSMTPAVSNQIAVLYASGEIEDGNPKAIDFHTLVPVILDLAENDKIKGMVLRVNSPGGSAYGSDQIGEALDYFMKKGKPLAVSMGDYAASGGYWISCCADRIYADPLTITGSIGIFGLIPNVSGLADKLGVSPQFVSTNPAANFPTLLKPMDEAQLGKMQKYVERGYDRFVNRVAKGRKMQPARVRQIAEGRVWSALKAKEIGLVDSIGSLNDAIVWTARKAKIEDKYKTAIYPAYEPSIWDMIALENMSVSQMIRLSDTKYWDNVSAALVRKLLARPRIMARMPEFEFCMCNN